ncbi:MAG TPA: hypothetical protein VF805_00020 [Anaeromyxobacteraceae bacterium]
MLRAIAAALALAAGLDPAASPPGEEVVAVVTLSMVACLMFSLAVLRRTPVRPAQQTP